MQSISVNEFTHLLTRIRFRDLTENVFFWATWAAFFMFSVTDASFSIFQNSIASARRGGFISAAQEAFKRSRLRSDWPDLEVRPWPRLPDVCRTETWRLRVFSDLHMFNPPPPLTTNAVNGTFGFGSERQKAHSKGFERIFLVSIKCQTYKRKKMIKYLMRKMCFSPH